MSTQQFHQHITCISIGVADLARSREFFHTLGWKEQDTPHADAIAFFNMGGITMALYPAPLLLEDAGIPLAKPAAGGITISHNVHSEKEVDDLLRLAEQAGGRILSPAVQKPWGYTGYFADIDGTPWEVAFVPSLQLSESGQIQW
ncbi:VOC family protein [Oleidesulfovibrio sp.]|uniref:VOC family protein n=1 Tax=Oleidesulfovibrio sp. TaxID=2909707 RepID=UPI003A89C0C1